MGELHLRKNATLLTFQKRTKTPYHLRTHENITVQHVKSADIVFMVCIIENGFYNFRDKLKEKSALSTTDMCTA